MEVIIQWETIPYGPPFLGAVRIVILIKDNILNNQMVNVF